jgi:hypothetical protein
MNPLRANWKLINPANFTKTYYHSIISIDILKRLPDGQTKAVSAVIFCLVIIGHPTQRCGNYEFVPF